MAWCSRLILTRSLASGGTPTLSGYIFWVDRMKVAELEAKYSQAFSEILGPPVQVVIGQNISSRRQMWRHANHCGLSDGLLYLHNGAAFDPAPDAGGKTDQDAGCAADLPCQPGQVVLGKALAGFFYILVIGGLALALFSLYIVNWVLALAAFLGYALLAIGLGLAVGSFIKSTKQSGIWMVVLILFLVIPPLFYMEPNLKPGIRVFLTWFPSSALASLFRFSCSTGVTPAQFLPNLAIAISKYRDCLWPGHLESAPV